VNSNKLKITQTILLTCTLAVWLAVAPPFAWAQTPPNGKYTARYANHNLKETGFYNNGQKYKRWAYYHENGTVERKEKWVKGELQWQIFYTAKGKISKTIDKKGKETIRPACGC
jgi:hypothetical protein